MDEVEAEKHETEHAVVNVHGIVLEAGVVIAPVDCTHLEVFGDAALESYREWLWYQNKNFY